MLEFMIVEILNIAGETFRIGYIKTLYQYRNDIAEGIKENNKNNVDVVGMIIEDKDSVSYRAIKDVDVSVIAEYFGGSGHKNAASNPKNNELFQKILRRFK